MDPILAAPPTVASAVRSLSLTESFPPGSFLTAGFATAGA